MEPFRLSTSYWQYPYFSDMDNWIKWERFNPVHVLGNKTNVICNVYVQKLIQAKKGGRIFYDVWVNVNEYKPQGKWQAEIGNTSENDWKLYFRNIKVQIRDCQYKIKNKILVTNSFIFKINKIDSEVCSYCREQPEKYTIYSWHVPG